MGRPHSTGAVVFKSTIYRLVVLAVLTLILASCQSFGDQGAIPANAPCSFGNLVLVPEVVCIRAEPARRPDGTWTYPVSNPEAARLHPGSILVVARKSVRRVESVHPVGDQISITTAAVPLTEVVKDGTIPLNASITPHSIEKTVDQPSPPPPPEPPPATVSPSPPSRTSSSPSPPVTPEISVSVRAVHDLYQGDCSAVSTDQEPTFEGIITVSAGPVTVAYHWTLADAKGPTASISGTLTFPGTGSQTKTIEYAVPVNPKQYLPDTNNEGEISLQADSPSTVAAPQQLPYFIDCSAASTSPGPGTSTSTSTSPGTSPVAGESRPAGDQPATLVAQTTSRGNGYQIEPSLTLGNDSFAVDVTASHQIGPAKLTWKLHGELDDFFSSGALDIVNHALRDSGLAVTRLHGQLRLDWALSAAVPQAIADKLSRDLHFRLFVVRLLVGDFPVFLALEIHPNVELDFKPGQLLHGYVAVGFSGSQGLSIHLRAIDHSNGLSVGGLRLDPGIRDLLSLPTLKAEVEFPYLSLGDDFYSVGAWLWTSPAVGVSVAPGHDPELCARGEAEVSASVGTEFQLFGFREPLSVQVFDHPLPPAVSFPRNPECLAS